MNFFPIVADVLINDEDESLPAIARTMNIADAELLDELTRAHTGQSVPVTFALYTRFWQLQEFFSRPLQPLDKFEQFKQVRLKRLFVPNECLSFRIAPKC